MPDIDDRTAYPLDGPLAGELRELVQGAPKTITGTSYTLLADDLGRLLVTTNGAAVQITVPSGLPANFHCDFCQDGGGQVEFLQGSGTTLRSYSSQRKILGQHCRARIDWLSSETYNLAGDLTA